MINTYPTKYKLINCFCILDLQSSTSATNIDEIDQVHQNYANDTIMTLDIIPKTLDLKNHIYHLRGVVVFEGGLRTGLRVTSGHYKAFAYRSNDHWEMYDDQKESVRPATKKKLNVEFLIYTL